MGNNSASGLAQRFGVTDQTIYSWIRTGKLKAFRFGKQYRVSDEDLAAFEASSRLEFGQETI